MKGFWTLKFHTTERPRHRASHVAQLPYLRSRLKAQGWRRRAAQRCGGQLCAGSRTNLSLQESLLWGHSPDRCKRLRVDATRWRKTHAHFFDFAPREKNTRAPLCIATYRIQPRSHEKWTPNLPFECSLLRPPPGRIDDELLKEEEVEAN